MSQIPEQSISQLNNRIEQLLKFEQRDYEYRTKKSEKYMTKDPNDPTNKNEEESENQKIKKKKELKKSGGFINDLLGFITKLGVMIAGYKIAEWVGNPKNTKKLANILQGFYNIGKFILNFVDGVFWWTKGTISNIFAVGKAFGDFFNGAVGFVQMILNPIGSASKALSDAPANIGKAFSGFLGGIGNSLDGASDKAVTDANKNIKDGVENLKPIPTPEPTPPTPTPEPTPPTPKPANFNNPTIPATPIKPESSPPKLAKGGIVSSATPTNNIKPLTSLLTGDTNNDKFNNEVKKISPQFSDLMKLPFSIIGSGIVGILKSAIKDNPESTNIATPLLNSVGKMFNVPVGDTKNNLKIGKEEDNNNQPTNNLDILIGKSNPTVNTVGETNNKFQSANDTTVRGLLADILNAFISKIPSNPLPQKSMGGTVSGSGSGWIQGSHDGYPVSLGGGKNTNFIGHGTEYVSKHKTNDSSFVIPYDTPSTKVNKKLTSNRINEAISKGYDVPKMADGGVVEPKEYKPGTKISELTTKNNQRYKIVSSLAPRFDGLVRGIEDTGYNINSIVGYDPKNKDTSGSPYSAPYGAVLHMTGNKVIPPKMRDKISALTQKYNIRWANHWGGQLNAMHFQAMISEEAAGDYLSTNSKYKNKLTPTTPTATTPTATTPTATTPTATTPTATTDFGKIGGAFTTLTQMLGVGAGKSRTPIPEESRMNPTIKDKPYKQVPTVTPLPVLDNPNGSGMGKRSKNKVKARPRPDKTSEPLKNTSPTYKTVPKVTPLPTPNAPYKTVPKVTPLPILSTNPINSTTIIGGDVINTANKTVYSTANFNFSSDLHRFSALSSMNGNVTDSIFV